MNKIYLIIGILLGLSSCYNYQGPTRPKETRKAPLPRVEKIKPRTTSEDYLKRVMADIKRRLPSAQVKLVEDSIKVLFPDNILYKTSSVLPKDDISNEISRLARLIIKYNKTNILITGHTDKSGIESENIRISELRAGYIKDLLISHKTPKQRISSWGFGSRQPLSSERIENGKNNNRRVEFVILSTIRDEE